MPEYKMTPADYNIKYEGCYVRLLEPEEGMAGIGLIEEGAYTDRDEEVAGFHVKTFTKDDEHLTVSNLKKVPLDKVELGILPTGVINTAKSIVIIHSYKPQGNAKYRALLHNSVTEVVDPLEHLRRKLDIRSVEGVRDYYILDAWAKANYPAPQEALEAVKSGNYLAQAFSNRFYFSISDRTDSVVLMYMNSVAGKVAEDKIELRGWATRFKDLLEGFGLECMEEAA